jgi:sulfur relay (sulfurtransferase) complex TusBCD TusD component (DsrE family)
MIYLEIQHGKEGMKNELHHNTSGATAGYTVRICERCTQVRGVKANAWFGSILTCVELVTHGFGFECIFQVT